MGHCRLTHGPIACAAVVPFLRQTFFDLERYDQETKPLQVRRAAVHVLWHPVRLLAPLCQGAVRLQRFEGDCGEGGPGQGDCGSCTGLV